MYTLPTYELQDRSRYVMQLHCFLLNPLHIIGLSALQYRRMYECKFCKLLKGDVTEESILCEHKVVPGHSWISWQN